MTYFNGFVSMNTYFEDNINIKDTNIFNDILEIITRLEKNDDTSNKKTGSSDMIFLKKLLERINDIEEELENNGKIECRSCYHSHNHTSFRSYVKCSKKEII